MTTVVVFEDAQVNDFMPLVWNRPFVDLRFGMHRLIDSVQRWLSPSSLHVHVRPFLKSISGRLCENAYINQLPQSGQVMFVSARASVTAEMAEHLQKAMAAKNTVYLFKGQGVAACLEGEALQVMVSLLKQDALPDATALAEVLRPFTHQESVDWPFCIETLDDLIVMNGAKLSQDCLDLNQGGIVKGHMGIYTQLIQEGRIFIEKGAKVEDFVYLDASNGSIYIDKEAVIQSGSRLEGPVYVGPGTHIIGGRIRNSSFGPHCKIGGEVSCSVFHSFSNKAHEGFVGHSYVGQWVNLGAGTTTSNLKNNYQPVTLHWNLNQMPTQELFLGSFIGDHVKTAIGTLLNTGTLVGGGSTLLGTSIHKKYIPPFSWGEAGAYVSHELDKFKATAQAMMARRNEPWYPEWEALYDHLS